MSGNVGIRQAIFGVSGVVLISKLLGFIREMVIAERFGTSLQYDIFLIAIAAPIFFNLVIVHSANYLTVPFLSRKSTDFAENSDWREIWSVFNSLLAVVLLLIGLIIIAAPHLVKLIGPNLEGEELRKGVYYCRAISALVFFGFLESFLRSALNVRKQFVYPMMGTIILNIVVISVIYLFSAKLSVGAILLGLLVGSFFQVIFLFLKFTNRGIFGYFSLKIFGPEVRNLLAVGGAIVAVELLMSTYFLIDRYFASNSIEGVVSALNYCSLLVMLPVSIVGYAISAVTFPYLSERSEKIQSKEFASLLHSALTMALVIGLPCGMFYLVFPRELTAAVFFRGAFDLNSLEITSRILITLAPYLVCLFLYTILLQSCYSSGRQKTVLMIALASIFLKFILTGLLIKLLDYPGIGLATSIVQTITICLLIAILVRDNRLTDIGKLGITAGKVIVASMPILVLAYFYKSFPDFAHGMSLVSKLRVIPAGIIAFSGFIFIGYFINISLVRDMFGRLPRIRK